MISTLSTREKHSFNKLQKRLRRQAGQAIADFNMIENNDKIMVCLSGGADSYTMLDTLIFLQKIAPVKFQLIAVNLDQKQPGFPESILPEYLKSLEIPYRIVERDTYSIVKKKIANGKTTCGLCSRLRRGILYTTARELGATKIALGHHKNDIVETLFLNMFYGGRLKAMPPKLISDDKENVVIRPLAYCKESDIKNYAKILDFPIIPCNLCGSQQNLQRQAIKKMMSEWDKRFPGRIESIFRAIRNVSPSHLADTSLFSFQNLQKDMAENIRELDYAFDASEIINPQL